MIEIDSSQVEDGLDLCVCQPYMENMKEISFEAIRNRTKYIRLRSSDTVEWLKCKYCDVRVCCRLDDDEDFEFETWSSTQYGSHNNHPPDGKVRPIGCYFEIVVRQMLANKISGAKLVAAVHEFFGYQLDVDAIRFVEKKVSPRRAASTQWQLLPSLVRHLQTLGSNSAIELDEDSTVKRAYIELKTVSLLDTPAFVGAIFLDGTACYDKVHSTLCIACTMTADHRIIPLGFVIGQGEKEEHYRFLLESMKHAMPKEVTIFSDQAQSILGAIDKALSDIVCHKKPCAWHIASKLPVPKKVLMQLLKMDNRAVMSSLLAQLTHQYPQHAEKLQEIVDQCAYLGKNQIGAFGLIADSPIESLNSAIMEWRRKEPIDMMVGIIHWTNKVVQQQLAQLRSMYCPSYQRLISYRLSLKVRMVIQNNSDKSWTITETFRGIDLPATYTVTGTHNPQCTCDGYKRDGAPCRHIAVLEARGCCEAPSPLAYYLSSSIREALMNTQMIPDVAELYPSDVKMPQRTARPGRPRYHRYKAAIEHLFVVKKTYRCTICHKTGHTSRTHDAWIRQHSGPRGRQTDQYISRQKREKTKRKMRKFIFDAAKYNEEHQE